MIIKTEIKEMLDKLLDLDHQTIEDNAPLAEYGLSSIKVISLVILIEDKLGIEFKDEDLLLSKFKTIEDICKLINKYTIQRENENG